MISFENAMDVASDTLKLYFSDNDIILDPIIFSLKTRETWIFKGKIRGAGTSVICKVGAQNDIGRKKTLRQFKQLDFAHHNVNSFKFKTPKPLAIFEEKCSFLMEDIEGHSFIEKVKSFNKVEDALPYLKKSGKWVSHYHAPTARLERFRSEPHTKWLRKMAAQHDEGKRLIHDYEDFTDKLNNLEILGLELEGLPYQRCVTHKDFHLGNVIFGKTGVTYGIDFENSREDIAVRDLISIFFDFTFRCSFKWISISELQPAFDALLSGYHDIRTHPRVFQYFQIFMALSSWSQVRGATLKNTSNHKFLCARAFSQNYLNCQ